MDQHNHCQGCIQRGRCQEAYERLGGFRGPSVVSKVLIAFLMPMVVFIVCLAVLERVLPMAGIQSGLKSVISLLGSLAVVALSIFAVRAGSIQAKRKESQKRRYEC